MRFALRFAVSAVATLFATSVVACSGGGFGTNADLDPSASGGNEPALDTPATPTGAASAGEPLVVPSDLSSITLAQGFCGGAPGTCNGRHSYTLRFGASATLEKTVCVVTSDKTTGNETTSHPLSSAEVARVRDLLAKIRVSHEPFSSWDGMMYGLTVTSASGSNQAYSPEATCNHDGFTRIAAGWSDLWSTVSTL